MTPQQQEQKPLLQRSIPHVPSSLSMSSSSSSLSSISSTISTFSTSSASSACSTPFTTIVTTPDTCTSEEETIWYLAYGSNMDPWVLTYCRKVTPLDSKRVRVPDYWLSFDHGGFPFWEPCFASILKREPERMREKEYAQLVHAHCRFGQAFVWEDGVEEGGEAAYPMELHGVLHQITLRDWDLIVHSEGGWGHDVPTGYDMIHVTCEVYTTLQEISARVLLARPKSIKPNCQPSLRYKNLITTGARHHNLDPRYQEALARIVPYTCQGPMAERAKKLFRVFNLPLEWTFSRILRVNRGKGREERVQPPYWMAWLFDKSYRFASWAHDWVLVPAVEVSGWCLAEGEMRLAREGLEAELLLGERKSEMNEISVSLLEV